MHVSDLSVAHVKALKYLKEKSKSIILNCGYGKGYSVLEILRMFKKIKKIQRQKKTKKLSLVNIINDMLKW